MYVYTCTVLCFVSGLLHKDCFREQNDISSNNNAFNSELAENCLIEEIDLVCTEVLTTETLKRNAM